MQEGAELEALGLVARVGVEASHVQDIVDVRQQMEPGAADLLQVGEQLARGRGLGRMDEAVDGGAGLDLGLEAGEQGRQAGLGLDAGVDVVAQGSLDHHQEAALGRAGGVGQPLTAGL